MAILSEEGQKGSGCMHHCLCSHPVNPLAEQYKLCVSITAKPPVSLVAPTYLLIEIRNSPDSRKTSNFLLVTIAFLHT